MYTDFAYSVPMQIILAVITFTETFCSMYMLSNLILAALGLSASRKQKALFAFLTGILLYEVIIYGAYIFNGGQSFSFIAMLFIITPNPISGLIYYFAAQKIFKLSSVRSIKLVSYIYLFWIAAKTLNRIAASTLFIQNEAAYKYMKDSFQQLTYFLVFFIIYKIAMYLIKRGHISFRFVDNIFFNRNKELLLFFLKATFAFAVRFGLPLIIPNQAVAYTLALIILIMFITINIYNGILAGNRQTISNRDVHISALSKGMEEVRGIRHDFNNILQTYSGYLELQEYGLLEKYHHSLVLATSHAGSSVELAKKMQENPAVITLLIGKLEYAERMKVDLRTSIKCGLGDLYIDNMDISRVLACLLDNAIEAAHDSKQRKVYITMESKSRNSKLIIITNSTASAIEPDMLMSGETTKPGHKGIGLSVIRKIIAKYGNCTFQMKYYDHEFSTYVELARREVAQ